ncbi:MAG: acylphosphatase [Dehalococcoidia bacterium]|nr:acylphosphatase [Dehalococcoidia bacterium]
MVPEQAPVEGDASHLHAVVRGRVQGVGFRYFAVERAEALNLSGQVRNLKGGAVEVVAEGTRESLESFLQDLWRGPRGAQVEGVEAHWGITTGSFRGFEVRY